MPLSTDPYDRRRRRVLTLAHRYDCEPTHSRHVTLLALSLFDQLQQLHNLGRAERELLEYAGLLHDIGYHISPKGHNKHSYELIVSADLPEFQWHEVRIIAAVARYHRKRQPKPRDKELLGLDASQRHTVSVLAGILRVADGLDRTHQSVVTSVRARIGTNRVDIVAHVSGNADAELWHGRRKSDLLEHALQKRVTIKALVPANAGSVMEQLESGANTCRVCGTICKSKLEG